MQIYIEYVIIDNLIFNYFLLALTGLKKGKPLCKKRVLLSSCIGTAVAIIFPLLKFKKFLLIVLKILLAFIMVYVAIPINSFKDYFLKTAKFLLITFSFGGAIFAIMSIFNIDYSFLYGTTNGPLPLGFLLLCAIILYYVFKKIHHLTFNKQTIYSFYCKCEAYNDGQKIVATGLIDSGNHLKYKNKGVCVVNARFAKELLLQGYLENSYLGNMQINTVTGKSKILLYLLPKLVIYFNNEMNIIYKAVIGISERNSLFKSDYDLILPSEFALTTSDEK